MIITVGIDVSKEKLDIYFSHTNKYETIENKSLPIKKLFKSRENKSDYRIVLEATGKYHRECHRILNELGYQVVVVNPFQARNFARAMNLQCKTDKLDAKVLSQYGVNVPCPPQKCMNKLEEETQEITRHLADLKQIRRELKCRSHDSKGFVKKSLNKSIQTLDKEIKATEAELDKLIQSSEELSQKRDLLESIPGIGRLTASVMLSLLRELGTLNKREVAALSGLAPMNWDSGKSQGRRRLGRGRHDIRAHLYMPTLGSISRHNKRLMAIYQRMIEAGKPKMVAITACMRKLVIWANAILATSKKWDMAAI